MAEKTEKAIFAAGCFWGVEDYFKKIDGVLDTTVGYSGGTTKHPTYEQVSTGKTGHAESILVEFNPKITPYQQLVEAFFKKHNPTTLNRQGPDVGNQYRSAIFYLDGEQKKTAEKVRDEVQKSYQAPLVTQIRKASPFYPAEEYHQDYYDKHIGFRCA